MPDLTIIYVQICTQETLSTRVISSKGDKEYNVFATLDENNQSCTCPGFGFRGKCRHIDEVRSQICNWNEQYSDEVQTPQQEMEGVCPKCSCETRVIRMGV